jgi:branched-chain amino acid transport system permease protein
MTNWIVLIAGTALLAALTLTGDNYLLRLATIVCMYATLAQSWNFIGGFAGYPSFATAAFFGLGAYVSAVLQNRGVPMIAGWGLAGLAALAFAAFIGGAILHLRGHYFAIASLIIAEMLREIVNTTPDFTGGGMGLNLPIMRISVGAQAQFFYFAMLALALLCTTTAIVVQHSKLGFGLRCIQQNEDAAIVLGVNTRRYKVMAFVLSAVFPGLCGGIYASWVNYIDPIDVYDVLLSVKPIVMALLGGAGAVLGPVYGAFLFLLLEELVWRNLLEFHAGLLGVIVVALVLFLPMGIRGIDWRAISGAWRKRVVSP